MTSVALRRLMRVRSLVVGYGAYAGEEPSITSVVVRAEGEARVPRLQASRRPGTAPAARSQKSSTVQLGSGRSSASPNTLRTLRPADRCSRATTGARR